jgi:hypothetical protein
MIEERRGYKGGGRRRSEGSVERRRGRRSGLRPDQ